jgi:uncharacterized membrane protein YhaH (DUF805 family)
MGHMFAPFRRFADFSGRSRRREYWLFQLLIGMCFVLFWVIGLSSPSNQDTALVLMGLLILVSLVPSLAVQVRRLHDIGKSGWWLFVGIVPIIGGIWLFALYVSEGDSGPNRYGDDPRGDYNNDRSSAFD